MLDTAIEEKWLTANAVIGFFPANAVGDDVEVYTDDTRTEVLTMFHNLRQQGAHRPGIPNWSLGDYIAPKETGLADYIGAFAVTAGSAAARRSQSSRKRSTTTARSCWSRSPTGWRRPSPNGCTSGFARSSGDSSPTRHWTTTRSSPRNTRIRPAPGYPACPEHTEKATIWKLMDVQERTRIELTDSMAMWPGAAVSGLYFSHPQSQYFVIGRLAQDQVADYAKRKGWTLAEAERWLGSNLGYNPED